VKGTISLIIGLKIRIGALFNQVKGHVVVAKDGRHVEGRHAVHEGLHEVLLVH
jgi:hypothetical protein